MIDIKTDIYDLLEEIPEIEVFFYYPDSFEKLPALSYYEVGNTTSKKSENKETHADIAIVVDVWVKGSTTQLAKQVDKKMTSVGLERKFARDLEKTHNDIQHKTMRYAGIISKDKKVFN